MRERNMAEKERRRRREGKEHGREGWQKEAAGIVGVISEERKRGEGKREGNDTENFLNIRRCVEDLIITKRILWLWRYKFLTLH